MRARAPELQIGLNMEFVRSEDKSFESGVELAAKLGYSFVEPMVHNGRELLSEAGYFHSFSMDNDPLEMKEILDRYGVRATGLSAHCPLMRPEISVPYLEKAVRFSAVMGGVPVNTDEGIRPFWLDDEECFQVMRYTLKKSLQIAERYRVYIAIEPHQSLTKTTEGLLRIVNLVESPMLKVNYDTGNALLAGSDPYEGLQAVMDRLVHVHAKDISSYQVAEEKGKVTGTPVGCACGDGVIDWRRVISILKEGGYSGALSVECGTVRQAAESLKHLNEVMQSELATVPAK